MVGLFRHIAAVTLTLALTMALALIVAMSAASAQTTVNFTSLDGTTNLTSYLSRPQGNSDGDAPRPAVVLMHGCSGLVNSKGRIRGLYQDWVKALVAQGYVALAVDSASSRGFGQTCSAGEPRTTELRDRPKDAYAALQYLQAQPFVRPDRVAVMGWSQGGGIVLLSINDKSIGRPAGLAHDFKAAVAFYPGACSERLQSKPYTEVEPNGWTTSIPLLTLFGEADTWTRFKPCEAFIQAAKARGNPLELKSYPLAVHAFDAPNLPRTELPAYKSASGPMPLIGTDPEARADAFPRVLDFLKVHLEQN